MPKFQEMAAKTALISASMAAGLSSLIAKRYSVQEKLGRGSFGTVYLVLDTKAREGEKLKVLKEIPVGDLNPNETVQANLEAQLLSQLHHPTILKFYTSFLERDSFCIITEYCEDKDLECKIEEYKETKKSCPESQITEWFIQLLLGVHYMHERRILHRDLKTKNIFLKNNIVKIGDFGVSRLLMGSCDLATTFTGTPYYMSPEVLSHQGYDSKSDVWSLGCILYEMCCLEHAFTGHNFLSVVMKIVEGKTPVLPDRYSEELNSILQGMLNKDPSLRLSAADILKMKFIEEHLHNIKHKFSSMTLKEKTVNCKKEAAEIRNALQKKVHLETLREQSEVQKMTPRERMRLRKLQAADEKAGKLKQLAEEKYQENCRRIQEFRSRNFQNVSVDVLHECQEQTVEQVNQTQPITVQDFKSLVRSGGCTEKQDTDRLCMSEPLDHGCTASLRSTDKSSAYKRDSQENDIHSANPSEIIKLGSANKPIPAEAQLPPTGTHNNDTDVEAMVKCLEDVLESEHSSVGAASTEAPALGQRPETINCTMAESKIQRMRQSIREKLGEEAFQTVYDYLKNARENCVEEAEIKDFLGKIAGKPSDCFEVDQLLYFEEQLLMTKAGKAIDKTNKR
ncbi:NEK11 kinase, partial [Atractosteus spatula]|nr:NEK11 kinase [Atractosteus spatula]